MKERAWLLQEKYNNREGAAFKKDAARLKKGEPLAYVIGSLPFLGCAIDLSKRPFIPRPETEYWVERAIEEACRTRPNAPMHCLDIFSGSGCIGIALLKHIPNTRVDFIEKSERLKNQIAINIKRNHIHQFRASILKSSLFKKNQRAYDYIFANPPYISRARIRYVQKSVLQWEPHEALFAPENGLYYIRMLIARARDCLLPHGTMYIEFDSWQKKSIEILLKKTAVKKYEFWKDQYHKWRVLVIRK